MGSTTRNLWADGRSSDPNPSANLNQYLHIQVRVLNLFADVLPDKILLLRSQIEGLRNILQLPSHNKKQTGDRNFSLLSY